MISSYDLKPIENVSGGWHTPSVRVLGVPGCIMPNIATE